MIGADEPGSTQSSSQQEDCSIYGESISSCVSLYRHNAPTARMTKVTGFNPSPTSRELVVAVISVLTTLRRLFAPEWGLMRWSAAE